MLSTCNMLIDSVTCQQEPYIKPLALNISFLLCSPPSQEADASDHQQERSNVINCSTANEEVFVQMIWSKHPRHGFTNSSSSPFYLLNKSLQRSSRQHQIESRKIEQELRSRRGSCSSFSSSSSSSSKQSDDLPPLKAKRRRASSKQLDVLNKVFDRTFFPSTQLRVELGRQLGMSPRTVQIWFQNKRQAIRTKELSVPSSCSSSSSDSNSRENSLSPE
jgi:hypothetical protein